MLKVFLFSSSIVFLKQKIDIPLLSAFMTVGLKQPQLSWLLSPAKNTVGLCHKGSDYQGASPPGHPMCFQSVHHMHAGSHEGTGRELTHVHSSMIQRLPNELPCEAKSVPNSTHRG